MSVTSVPWPAKRRAQLEVVGAVDILMVFGLVFRRRNEVVPFLCHSKFLLPLYFHLMIEEARCQYQFEEIFLATCAIFSSFCSLNYEEIRVAELKIIDCSGIKRDCLCGFYLVRKSKSL